MARSMAVGFETGEAHAETNVAVTGSGVTFDSTISRTGTWSMKIALVSATQGWLAVNPVVPVTMGMAIRVTARPATTARLIQGSTSAGFLNLRLNADGTIGYYTATTLIGTSAVALTDTAKWYWLEFRVGDGTSKVLLRIDEVDQVTGTTTNSFSSAIGAQDTVADTYTAYFDDVIGDDATWPPGNSKVAILLPASLNAAGSWTEGDGAGTAGMVGAVSTSPPPGVASASETSATNIESAANSATDNCDFNCTDYTTAGVSGTVNAVQSIVRHGEDIATSTKAGASLIVSNPAQVGEDTFNFGDDAGAHGAESAGLWKTKRGTIQTAPSVTLGTQPVLRIGKRTATTRVVCADFMGIYVDYTPATTRTLPLPQPSNFQDPAVF